MNAWKKYGGFDYAIKSCHFSKCTQENQLPIMQGEIQNPILEGSSIASVVCGNCKAEMCRKKKSTKKKKSRLKKESNGSSSSNSFNTHGSPSDKMKKRMSSPGLLASNSLPGSIRAWSNFKVGDMNA